MYINNTFRAGLFESTRGTAEIKNLLIKHVGIYGTYAAAVVVQAYENSPSINNVRVTSPNNSSIQGYLVGSVVGQAIATSTTISASSDAKLELVPAPNSLKPDAAGGVIAIVNNNATITGYFSGSMSSAYETNKDIGGGGCIKRFDFWQTRYSNIRNKQTCTY